MEYLISHLRTLIRQHSIGKEVFHLGVLTHKTLEVNRRFDHVSFSLIFEGSGLFEVDGKPYRVEAPCGLIKLPNHHYHYVPDEEWSEVFISYPKECLGALQQSGYIRREQPVWKIGNAASLQQLVDALMVLMQHSERRHQVDRIDRMCDQLLFESLADMLHVESEQEQRMHAAHNELKDYITRRLILEEYARTHGMSYSHFRRLWKRYYGEAPGSSLARLRIREACRLLVQTETPIARIAEKVQFEDALYFSKRFKQLVGYTPSQYRDFGYEE